MSSKLEKTKLYSNLEEELSNYEKIEIFNYSHIYYISKLEYKIQNEIYSKNDKFIIKANDHISYRFQIIKKIGSGTYGNVIKVLDHKHYKYKAIKIFNNISYISSKKLEKLFYNELTILHILLTKKNKQTHPQELITLFKTDGKFRNHNYIIFKLYGDNLYRGRTKIASANIHYKLIIIKDILHALDFLTSSEPKIIHGDIKPENILFKNDLDYNVVIGDFGLSSKLTDEYIYSSKLIQTRWYRSPEIIYNIPFNEKIDIWSAGCIIYEIMSNHALFKAPSDEDQLIFIHYILGSPSHEYIESNDNIGIYYNTKYKPIIIDTTQSKRLVPGRGCEILDSYFNTIETQESKIKYNLIRLVYRCLEYNSVERISSKESIEFINTFNSHLIVI